MSDNPLSRIAPELVSALELFPDLDFSGGVEGFRGPFGARQVPPLPPGLAVVHREERMLPGLPGEPDVRVLHYTPPGGAEGRPAVLHIHGGGYVMGSADIMDFNSRWTAMAFSAAVVSVDYRLAPETVWPGALHDCYAALAWMHDNAEQLGIDPGRIAVLGESAGGGHAMALALFARDKARENAARGNGNAPSICFLLLDAPMLDDRTGTHSDPHPHAGHFIWTPDRNRFGWRALLGVEPGGPDVPVQAVPARAEDVSDLPPTFISVGALDLFLEEDMEFVRRLTRAGVAAELYVIPGAYHGFTMAQGSPQATQLMDLRQRALTRALGR